MFVIGKISCFCSNGTINNPCFVCGLKDTTKNRMAVSGRCSFLLLKASLGLSMRHSAGDGLKMNQCSFDICSSENSESAS